MGAIPFLFYFKQVIQMEKKNIIFQEVEDAAIEQRKAKEEESKGD